jgi:hypothetical protein
MAPRAGFQIDRKHVIGKDGGFAKRAHTPSSTPETVGALVKLLSCEWCEGKTLRRLRSRPRGRD